jgi:hypothetical protein
MYTVQYSCEFGQLCLNRTVLTVNRTTPCGVTDLLTSHTVTEHDAVSEVLNGPS